MGPQQQHQLRHQQEAPPTFETTSEQQLIESVILSRLSRNKTATAADVPPILRDAVNTISNIWATSTWSGRAGLWQRLQQFSDLQSAGNLPLGARAAAFVSSIPTASIQTTHTYAKTFRALATRFEIKTPLLDMYIAALRASGATVPMEQAYPARREHVRALIEHTLTTSPPNMRLAVAIYLVWKTASRWDDILHLKKESLIHADNTSLVIEWGQTKTTRADPFRVSGWTVVEERNYPDMLDATTRTFRSLKAEEPLIEMPTRLFARMLTQYEATKHLTAHSFKRGAIGVLIEAAMQGLIEPRMVPIMAKHKDPLHDFPVTTLRYAPNKVDLARMLGTQNATRLL
jgi:hypothetical protein